MTLEKHVMLSFLSVLLTIVIIVLVHQSASGMGTGLTTYRIKGTGREVLQVMQYCGPDQMVEGVAP